LFDPFFTTKGKAGTGMGLAVSFGIIRRHNGSIEVESEPGHGTTFSIALPTASNTQKQGSASVSLASAFAANGDRLRVLVVDDEGVVREVLKEALESEGCEVIAAESGEEALKLYDENKGQIDLVFTDIGMSDMSGWDLVTAIRKRSETIPVAIVSGWAEAISWDTRTAAKADWVVSKPFDIGKISAIANEISERKKTAKFPNG
jgi:CheY-like chemotaxis protein